MTRRLTGNIVGSKGIGVGAAGRISTNLWGTRTCCVELVVVGILDPKGMMRGCVSPIGGLGMWTGCPVLTRGRLDPEGTADAICVSSIILWSGNSLVKGIALEIRRWEDLGRDEKREADRLDWVELRRLCSCLSSRDIVYMRHPFWCLDKPPLVLNELRQGFTHTYIITAMRTTIQMRRNWRPWYFLDPTWNVNATQMEG